MALDPTARESNVRDSIKKYFVDNIARTENVPVIFDRGLSEPKLVGQRTVSKWVSINFEWLDMNTLAEINLDVILCTREDPEGYQLAHLRDKVMGYLVDTDQTDGMARITHYKSQEGQPWIELGGMIVQSIGPESPQMVADDGTKYKIIPVRIRWGAKV